MEFRDLKKQYSTMKEEIDSAIKEVVECANFISGSHVYNLESKLSKYVGTKYCITCANGTDALILALKSWGVKEGDAVFVPDFTFFSSAECVSICGATPIFVDVERDTFNISVNHLEYMINQIIQGGRLTPKVIIAVDLFGQPANYSGIHLLAEKYKLLVLEDGAQGFGGRIDRKVACSFGDISTTSFFPAKPLGCYGDGGAIFTNNDYWAEKIRSLCIHGKGRDKYDNVCIGMNSRLDTIQAAVLQVKFKYFIKYELEQVNQVASWYKKYLNNCICIPNVKKNYFSSWAQYTIVCKSFDEREKIKNELLKKGIPTMTYYKKALHEQIAFQGKCIMDINYENADYLTQRVLSLPIHPYLLEEEVFEISKKINQITS